MENVTTTPEGQAGTNTVASVASAPTGTDTSVDASSFSLKDLNDRLGKSYPDKETALKSLKDTFSYVGKKLEAIQPQPTTDPTVAAQLREMKTELFYSKNPQYDTPELRTVIGKMGENPADVVNDASFKTIFDKTTSYDKIQKTKTVLESNPRIGQVRNKMSEAKEATRNRDYTTANKSAVAAVLESYEM